MTAEASESVAPSVNPPAGSTSGLHSVVPPAAQPQTDAGHGAEAGELPAGYLSRELEDAERLLSFASETGLAVDAQTVDAILKARSAHGSVMSAKTAAGLLVALSKLAASSKPVTAESLRACARPEQANIVIRNYTLVAMVLGACVLVFSIWAFVSASLSDSIRKDTETANDLALHLAGEDQSIRGTTPTSVSQPEMLKELQQFAVLIRSINAHAKQLSWAAPAGLPWRGPTGRDGGLDNLEKQVNDNPFELPVPLDDLKAESAEAQRKVKLYQRVRYRAVTAQETAALWNGAVTTCLLPVLYAILGACAYLLRLYEEQRRTRTFIQDGHRARFFIAGIGGLVLGLFDKFNLSPGASLSPLAVAFLVGYAVDVFFSFLEGLLKAFGKTGDAGAGKEAKA